MKTITIKLMLMIAALISACSGNKDDDPAPQPPGNYVRFKLDGVLWEATDRASAWVSNPSETNPEGVSILGKRGDGMFNMMTSKQVAGPGTYSIPISTGGGFQLTGTGKVYVEKKLFITITVIKKIGNSKYVKGTFEGTVVNVYNKSEEYQVTEGEFQGF